MTQRRRLVLKKEIMHIVRDNWPELIEPFHLKVLVVGQRSWTFTLIERSENPIC